MLDFVLMTHSDFEEAAAERWPTPGGFEEGDFGLLHGDATLHVVGGDDALQIEAKAK